MYLQIVKHRKSKIKNVNPNARMHDHSLSWLGTCTPLVVMQVCSECENDANPHIQTSVQRYYKDDKHREKYLG